ncbi:MAG: hypothetical protein ACPGU1_20155 [Myxococcota bacterium]
MRLKCGVSVVIVGLCLGTLQGCVEDTTGGLCGTDTSACDDGDEAESCDLACSAADAQDSRDDVSDTEGLPDTTGPPFRAPAADGFPEPADALLKIESAILSQDSNRNGLLSPGEVADLRFTARNVGGLQTGGISMSLMESAPFVEIIACDAQLGDAWTPCDSECNCQEIPDDAKVTLGADESTEAILLRVRFTLVDSAPIAPLSWRVALHDERGDVWEDEVLTEVAPNGASLSIHTLELHDDSDADGALSPGESASLHLFATNEGAEDATGVWAQLLTLPPGVTVLGCFATSPSEWAECSDDCACDSLHASALQDLPREQTSETAILRIDIALSLDIPLSPLVFGIALIDSYNVTWTDTVSWDVQAP